MTDPTPDVPTLRRLLADATPAPWHYEDHGNGFAPMVIGGGMAVAETFDKPHHSDAALIVAAVNSLPDILHRLEAAEGAVARAWDAGEKAGEHYERAKWYWQGGNRAAMVVNGYPVERPMRPTNPHAEVTP